MAENDENSIHTPVLLQEILEGLHLREGDTVLDGTINGGGHSAHICSTLGKDGTLIGIDLDSDALKRAEQKLKTCSARVILVEDNYRNLDAILDEHEIDEVNGLLLDLGFSSDQLERGGRGFSFQKDEPLLLTLKAAHNDQVFTAHTIVNEWGKAQIEQILEGYGEERFARRIAEKIVEVRGEREIKTTADLVEIVKAATPPWYRFARLHPATKTFQALRIAVNDEIESLREGLLKGIARLASEGRFAVISFHSIEDRIVKRTFLEAQKEGRGRAITKKPITASEDELRSNPRARSAKLRIFQKQ